jgi:hypothetical protein
MANVHEIVRKLNEELLKIEWLKNTEIMFDSDNLSIDFEIKKNKSYMMRMDVKYPVSWVIIEVENDGSIQIDVNWGIDVEIRRIPIIDLDEFEDFRDRRISNFEEVYEIIKRFFIETE